MTFSVLSALVALLSLMLSWLALRFLAEKWMHPSPHDRLGWSKCTLANARHFRTIPPLALKRRPRFDPQLSP